jgi:hypothetical protein
MIKHSQALCRPEDTWCGGCDECTWTEEEWQEMLKSEEYLSGRQAAEGLLLTAFGLGRWSPEGKALLAFLGFLAIIRAGNDSSNVQEQTVPLPPDRPGSNKSGVGEFL